MSDTPFSSLKNREIRAYARERLLGNMLVPVMITIFVYSTRFTFEMVLSLGIMGRDLFSFLFYIALFIVMNSLWGIIKYGICNFYLSFITGKNANPIRIFAGFRQSTEVIICASLFLTVINVILMLPYLIYSFFFSPNNYYGLGVSFLLLLVANLFSLLIESYLAPLYFVICDYPGMRLTMVIIMTLSLMNTRNFFKYLFLQISFIPLYILSIMSCGIGLLWVTPYVNTSYAYFYENLCLSFKPEGEN